MATDQLNALSDLASLPVDLREIAHRGFADPSRLNDREIKLMCAAVVLQLGQTHHHAKRDLNAPSADGVA